MRTRPCPKDREAIFDPLLKYNDSKAGTPSLAALAVLLGDPEHGTVVGGLWGHSVYDWLSIELLFVPEEIRRNGIGSTLMRKAEAVAVKWAAWASGWIRTVFRHADSTKSQDMKSSEFWMIIRGVKGDTLSARF